MPINPIISGFSPDPSIVKVDKWYYLVTSTFHLFPGLPIYVSDDLVSWKQIGNVIHRQSQLSLLKTDTKICELAKINDVMLATGGLYAPTIRYHQGVFYVVCTNVLHENGKDTSQNFVVSTSDIWSGQWSNPIYFEFRGIDPSLLFDDDGRVYIQGSAGPGPMTRIANFEIDVNTGKRLSEQKDIWTGTGGIYPEGPHVYKRNGKYYLMISEGGTHENHMITMARSDSIWGPYEPCPHNPILTARGTDEYISYTGHCDAFEDEDGQWWGVCLGVRKDLEGRYIMGRESFLTRGNWSNDWLTFETVKSDVVGLIPKSGTIPPATDPYVDFLYIRDATLSNFHFTSASSVTITATPIDLSQGQLSPTFVGKRQRLLDGATTATIRSLSDTWGPLNIKAGVAVYKDEHRYGRMFYEAERHAVTFELVNKAKDIHRVERRGITGALESVLFRLEYTEQEYQFCYAIGPRSDLIKIAVVDTLDMTGRDFVGPVCGVFATANTDSAGVEFSDFQVA